VDGRWFDGRYSGVVSYITGLYNALSLDPNINITIVGNNIDAIKKSLNENISIIKLARKSEFLRLNYDIPKLIKQYNFDYAHFQYVCPIIKSCKYVVTIHDLLFLDFMKYFPKKFIIKNSIAFFLSSKLADLLLTVSQYSRQKISFHFSHDIKKIFITPNGISKSYENTLDKVLKNDIVPDNQYLLFVSRIENRKNHILLVKSFVELKLYKAYSLVLVGSKTFEVNQLDDYLKQLSIRIKKKIIFLKSVSNNDLLSLYKHTELFVFPSIAEGFGIPPLEAINAGAKTICSNQTALADFNFMKDYQFNPYNLSDLKNMIIKGLNDKSYPIIKYQNFVKKKYEWIRIANNFKKLLINNL
jgi:glycosyltransferase involved in cell wall biosynthesis